ncbi:putative glutathione S-transferase [Rosa sericea]
MAEEEAVKLFGTWRSPFSRRVEIALKLKGVDFEYYEEDLTNKSHLLLKYNPVHKKIPVLVHNEKPIVESLVILEYIDETWNEGFPILPKDPYQRSHARFWARFLDEKCLAAIEEACLRSVDRQKAVEEACELLKLLENELKDNKFFGGETIGLVDIVANVISCWLKAFQQVAGVELLTKEKLPKLCEWSDEFVSHAVIKGCLPPSDKLLASLRAHFETVASK